jgi:hypothetical protein
MQIADMHTAFKLELDKTSSLNTTHFEPSEIDFWLNSAIRNFVKTRYSGFNAKRKGFEQSQKRIDDLRTLVAEHTLVSGGGGGLDQLGTDLKPNGWRADLSYISDYWFSLGEEVEIEYTPFGETIPAFKRVGVTECTEDTYMSHINDPYSEHILHYDDAKPLRLFIGDDIEFITDGNYDLSSCYIRYLKAPQEVDISGTDSDLPEHTHDEIVKMAVNMGLENIEQQRYQTHSMELSKIE